MTLTKRIEFRVDDSFVATVTEIAKRTHKSKAEVLRDAVNLYYKAIDEWETNRRGIVFQSIDENSGNKSATEEHCFA